MNAHGQIYADFFDDAPEEDKKRFSAALAITGEQLLDEPTVDVMAEAAKLKELLTEDALRRLEALEDKHFVEGTGG